MAQDYYSGLIPDFWTSYRQKRATGGRSLTGQEMRGLVDPMLSNQYRLEMAAADRSTEQNRFDQQMAMKNEALAREKEAAQAQGLVNLGGMYGQYKVGMATADALKAAMGPGAGLTGQAPAVGGAAAEGLLTTGAGELKGSLVPGMGEAPAIAGKTAFPAPSMLAEAATEQVASTTLTDAALGAMGPASLAGGVTSLLLRDQSELVQAGGSALAGGIAGYMAIGGSVGGPAGFIIGAAIGGVTSLVDDVSVVCSELKRQGLLDRKIHRAATMYALKMASPLFYTFYRAHGDKLVPLMKRSKLFTYLVLPFGRGLAREAAHRYDPVKFPRGSVIARMYERFLFRKANRMMEEVSHATR